MNRREWNWIEWNWMESNWIELEWIMCILRGWFSMDWIADDINTSILYTHNIKNCYWTIFYVYICIDSHSESGRRQINRHCRLECLPSFILLYIDHININVLLQIPISLPIYMEILSGYGGLLYSKSLEKTFDGATL